MNALVEISVIDALYRASQAGVQVDLLIRGICCLRAGVPGVSERIRVTSIVDRFLEHSRVFYFENAGSPEVFLASADWMPRNFIRRVEVMFPVEEPKLKARIVDEILPTVLGDNVKARAQQADGAYQRLAANNGNAPLRSQAALQGLARESARESAREMGNVGRRPFVPILRRAGKNGKGDSKKQGASARPPRRGLKARGTRKGDEV